jgi:hypothetical protein
MRIAKQTPEGRREATVLITLGELQQDSSPVMYSVLRAALTGSLLIELRELLEVEDEYELLLYVRKLRDRGLIREPRDLHFERS